MAMDTYTKIGLKYIGTGLLAFLIVAVIAQFLFPSPTGLVGAAVAIMSSMVMSAAKDAYKQGKASLNTSVSTDKGENESSS